MWLALGLVCAGGSARAQAPATLADFNGHVLTLTSAFSFDPSQVPAAAIRFSSPRPPEFSGNLFLLSAPANGPTNAAYTQLNAADGLLRLSRYSTVSDWETNHITLRFASAASGSYSNWILRAGLGFGQTNLGSFTLTPGTNIPPRIIVQATGDIYQPGVNLSLFVGSTLGWDLRHQWRHEDSNLPGATSTSIAINDLQPANTGNYSCVVSNPVGVTTSAVIRLEIAQPVVITRQPQDQTVPVNSWAALDIQAGGSIRNYTWYRNGGYVAGGTNYQLFLPITTTADAGNYHVVLDNYGLFVTSQVAVIRVQSAVPDATWLDRPFQRVAIEGQAVPDAQGHTFNGWTSPALTPRITFRDGRIHFVAGTTAGVRSLFRWDNGVLDTLVFTNTPRPDAGTFHDVFYPTDEGAGQVNFVGAGSGMYTYSSGTITSHIGTNTPAPGRPGAYLGGPGSFGRRGPGIALDAPVVDAPGSFNALGAGIYFHDGSTLTRIADDTTDLPGAVAGYGGRPSPNAVNFDGTTIVFSTLASLAAGAPGGFYKATRDGTITKLADYTDNRPGGTLKFSGFGDIDVDGEYIFAVANSTVWRFMPDGTVTNVGSGMFVSAAGPRTAYYGNQSSLLRRWSNGTNLNVLSGGSALDGKQVSQVLAVDGHGDDVAVLVKFADLTHGIYLAGGPAPTVPVITREPPDVTIIEQGTAVFPVSAAGTQPLRYQWRRNGVPLEGQTNASIEIPRASVADEAAYSVVIANNHGSVTSRPAVLTTVVPARPVIWAHPASPLAYYGSNATFQVIASGAPPLHYQWFKRVGIEEIPIPGANAATLTLANLGPSDKASYFVATTNAHGTVVSSPATIASLLPWITGPPQPTTNLAGTTAAFTVSVLGVPPITYQWFKYPVPITALPGETNATLTFNAVSTNQAGPYAVRVTTPDGSLFTSPATLTVHTAATPNAPVLGVPSLVNGTLVFSLPTQAGYSYQVQSKTNLEDPSWTPEQTVAGDGATKAIAVSADGPRKFLRVIVLP